jgi:hypothetical protein
MNAEHLNSGTAGLAGKKNLTVYAIIDRDSRPSIWLKVGAAFANQDGSINLVLDAFPIGTNRLQVRERRLDEVPRPAHANGNGAAHGALDAEGRP